MSNEEIIWNYLYQKLQNPYSVAALMGNLKAESGLNPKLANGVSKLGLTNAEYTKAVDEDSISFDNDGIAYGLVQWYYHTRKKALLDFAKSKNKSVGDIHVQLDYMWEEIKTYKSVYNILLNADNIETPCDTVMFKYEKPSNTSQTMVLRRRSYAKDFFNAFYKPLTTEIKIKKSSAQELLERLKGENL